MDTNVARARKLIKQVNAFDEAYFNRAERLISDDAYDQLWFELNELLGDDEVKKSLGRDDMPLGAEVVYGKKVSHPVKVLSLDKQKITDPQLEKRIRAYAAKTKQNKFTVQHKLDGMTLVVYRTEAGPVFVTRGGGISGEDVTRQFRDIEQIWNAAMAMVPGDAVRGEALILKDSPAAANRSAVSGVVRSKEAGAAREAHVKFITYELLDHRRHTVDEATKLQILRSYGFDTIETTPYIDVDTLLEVLGEWQDAEPLRESFNYDIDGLVVKPEYEPAGISGTHHQFGQLAIKLAPRAAVTKITGVEWNAGKKGLLTPVALFEPVEINNAQYSRASLGSYSLMRELGLKIGSEVEVSVMNDVIPKVTRVLGSDGEEIEKPENTHEDGKHIFVNNYTLTPAELFQGAAVWFKWALTPSVVESLVDAGYTRPSQLIGRQLSDALTKNQAEKLYVSIDHSKATGYGAGSIAAALGADGIGARAAEVLDTASSITSVGSTGATARQIKAVSSLMAGALRDEALELQKFFQS